MFNFTQFQRVFPVDGAKPYESNGMRETESLRQSFNGELFIDRVLKQLGIGEVKGRAVSKVYPPTGDSGLRDLHLCVCDAKVPPHHKLSLLFYLLLDYDSARGLRSHLADDFAADASLPHDFQLLMRGLWLMDHRQFKPALEFLGHPSLPTEFADDIITVLVRQAESDGRGDYSLPLAYYHAKQPVLKTAVALEALFSALARTLVSEALVFSRSGQHPEPARRRLFQHLVQEVLAAADGNATPGGDRRMRQLATLVLDKDEEAWLDDYLTTGPGRPSTNAAKMLEMRRLVMGRSKGPGEGLGAMGTRHAA